MRRHGMTTKALALLFVLFIASQPLSVQTPAVKSEQQARIDALTEVVKLLKEQLADAKSGSGNLTMQLATSQQLNQQNEAKLAILQSLNGNLEKDKTDLSAIVAAQREMMTILQDSVKDRDSVIKELAKGNKRSAFERIADSIPSVAGLIALALVRK